MQGDIRGMKIAVIGGGAGCVAFLHHFVDLIGCLEAKFIKIKVYERRERVGPGLAYQEDCDSVLLNRGALTMSASGDDLSTFSAWIRWRMINNPDMRRLVARGLSSVYADRPLFGYFLQEFLSETHVYASKKGIDIEFVNESVVSINKGVSADCVFVATDNRVDRFDYVVMAVGNLEPSDIYGLEKSECYVNNPYPLSGRLDLWNSAGNICIIGSGLTAVDVAVSLKKFGYRGRIDMLSRCGLLPFVRGVQGEKHVMRYLTEEAIVNEARRSGEVLSLRKVLRLLRRELKGVGEDWRRIFRIPKGAKIVLHSELQESLGERPWQKVLAATNDIIELVWHKLSLDSRRTVFKKFYRSWMACRAPMPRSNAELLYKMMESGQLRVFACSPCFDLSSGSGVICGCLGEEGRVNYDYVINATGSGRWVRSERSSPLVWQMLGDAMAVEDEFGGVSVDFDTASLIDGRGVPDERIRVIGHLTSGTYFFVSSLEMVARKAHLVAEQMARNINYCKMLRGSTDEKARSEVVV